MTKILNIGLPRTGTYSLSIALLKLGYKTKHYPENIDIISNYDAACEVVFSYEELERKYPNSMYIFTTRNLDDWLRSCKHHIKHYKNNWNPFWKNRNKWKEIYEYKLNSIYFFKTENFKNRFIFLDLNDNKKWKKLCNFLRKPIPNFDYPNLNKSKAYKFYL